MFLNFQSCYGSTTFPVAFLVSGIALCDGVGIKEMGRKIVFTAKYYIVTIYIPVDKVLGGGKLECCKILLAKD